MSNIKTEIPKTFNEKSINKIVNAHQTSITKIN